MGLKGHDSRDIFADFRTNVYPPVSPTWFQPKSWGTARIDIVPFGIIFDPQADFVADDIQIGDAAYILEGEPFATTVTAILTELDLRLADMPSVQLFDVHYKVGHGQPHTMTTLSAIVSARRDTFYTVHHAKLWTGAQIRDWNLDETGEVYVIGHDTKKARWLDGEIPMPVWFPDQPDLPPQPMNIADWESRFPGQPRPDYPPGLEPGGDLRHALIEKYGSLRQAEEATEPPQP